MSKINNYKGYNNEFNKFKLWCLINNKKPYNSESLKQYLDSKQ